MLFEYFLLLSCALGFFHYVWFNSALLGDFRARLQNGDYKSLLMFAIPNKYIADKVYYAAQCANCLPFWVALVACLTLRLVGEIGCGIVACALLVLATTAGSIFVHRFIVKSET